MYKLRFHLGAGKHFKHWQIRSEAGVSYYRPAEVQLSMLRCVLKSNKKKAAKVYTEQKRDVCGWVECESLFIKHITFVDEPVSVEGLPRMVYDPKINPHWKVDGDSDNYDMLKVDKVISSGNHLFMKWRHV